MQPVRANTLSLEMSSLNPLASLQTLPKEIIKKIFLWMSPDEIINTRRVCRRFNALFVADMKEFVAREIWYVANG